jgi:hypothetical protein
LARLLEEERPLLRARAYILWLVMLGLLTVSCGGGGASAASTCFLTNVTYGGTKSGAAYLRVASDDAGQTVFHAVNGASIQALISLAHAEICYEGGNPVDIPLTAVAWIDASSAAASNCSDVLHPQPLCQPAATDPQAHQSAVLRFGQRLTLQLDIVDPP